MHSLRRRETDTDTINFAHRDLRMRDDFVAILDRCIVVIRNVRFRAEHLNRETLKLRLRNAGTIVLIKSVPYRT
jgi:hypothetical protein